MKVTITNTCVTFYGLPTWSELRDMMFRLEQAYGASELEKKHVRFELFDPVEKSALDVMSMYRDTGINISDTLELQPGVSVNDILNYLQQKGVNAYVEVEE